MVSKKLAFDNSNVCRYIHNLNIYIKRKYRSRYLTGFTRHPVLNSAKTRQQRHFSVYIFSINSNINLSLCADFFTTTKMTSLISLNFHSRLPIFALIFILLSAVQPGNLSHTKSRCNIYQNLLLRISNQHTNYIAYFYDSFEPSIPLYKTPKFIFERIYPYVHLQAGRFLQPVNLYLVDSKVNDIVYESHENLFLKWNMKFW